MNKKYMLDICNYIKELDKTAKALEADSNSENAAKEARKKYSDALFITLFWLLTLEPEDAAVISKQLVDDFGTK